MNDSAALRDESRSESIKSIHKAVDVLNLISLEYKHLSDIARKLEMSKSTVHRLLQTLKESGLVHQDPNTQEYYPGPVLFKLVANPFKAHQQLIYLAYAKMDYLRSFTGETIALAIKFGMERLTLLQLTGTQNVTFVGSPKYSELVWTGAMGKVLLAQLAESELDLIINHTNLISITPRTITDKPTFKQEIAKVKQRGYSTSYGETDMSVGAIAAPINNYYTPAGLSIIGPLDRLSPHIQDFTEELRKLTQEISQDLKNTLSAFDRFQG
jgi:IclR family transcriptional regulator, acetate operon repressor